MTASRIRALWPWPRPSNPVETQAHPAADETPSVASSADHDALADVDMPEPAVLPTHRYAALHHHLFEALATAQTPDTATVDTVMTRHEALRHWVPRFKAWRQHPRRVETFFRTTQWPPLDPVAAGVLMGLAYRAHLAACKGTSDDARGAQERLNLATATHHGLLSIPDMQPYAAFLDDVQERDSRRPLPNRLNFPIRTLAAVKHDYESLQPPDVLRMQAAAVDILTLCPSQGLPYKRVKPAPEAIAWEVELAETGDAARLEKLQADVVSFIQYHNQQATGREIVSEVSELIKASARSPELLANLHFSQGPLSLDSDFLAGALVGTLYLGMLCGLRDLRRGRRRQNAAHVVAHSKLVSERMHKALSELATAIDAEHWRQLSHIVQHSLDAGVQAREIYARLSSYVEIQERHLSRIQNPTGVEHGMAEQWGGITWRLTQYQVVKL